MKLKFTLYIFILTILPSIAQITKVRGTIVDGTTKEALPFVTIALKGSTMGSVTDFNGKFFLETRLSLDTLLISYVGYLPLVKKVNKFVFQELNIELYPDTIHLQEVVITPGENLANPLIRNIIKNKEKNNPENIDYYNCKVYTKIEFDLNNVDEAFQKKKMFNQFQFVFDNIDTNTITGKAYLPVLISETTSDYYYKSSPKEKREVINGSQVSGVKNESISQLIGRFNQTFNIYDNFMTFYESGFVSPISDNGFSYYRYYLIDTAIIDGKRCFNISYKPKRKQERVFYGNFWVVDTSWAIKKMQMQLVSDANLNFINEIAGQFEYSCINDSIWYLSFEEFMVDFNLSESDKLKGLFGTKTSYYQKPTFHVPFVESVEKQKTIFTINEGAMDKNKDYWDTIRPIKLSEKEQRVYKMVDSIKNVPLYQTVQDIVYLLSNYYYVIGYFEWGPYFSTYSFNAIEGNRFRFGGQTSNTFSKKLLLNGYVAYGTKDEKFKYGANVLYMFNKNPRVSTSLIYKNDIEQLGESFNAMRTDNILTSILRRNPNYKLTPVINWQYYFEKEWFQGFSNKVTLNYKEIYSSQYIPFQQSINHSIINYNRLIMSDITLHTHYAYDEIFLMGEFERLSLGSKYPMVDLFLTKGYKNVFNSNYNYFKPVLRITHYININPIGYFKYSLEGGKIYGNLPFPLLELHRGNETYAYDYYAFNMMNYYEFVSDQYVSLNAEQHLQGFLLNHIPLMRKLKWREVLSLKGVVGTLNQSNRNLMILPEGINEVNEPYFETSVGVENIFKVFRVDAVWRLNHLDHPDIEKFGVRIKMQLIL